MGLMGAMRRQTLLGRDKVHLLFVGVDAVHGDLEAAADAVGFAFAAANKAEAGGIEEIEIVLEG